MTRVRTRYAPSPTGFMHVGNLRTALYEYLIAKSQKGKFILRIEDTDQERYVEGAVDIIYRTLAECGLDHDEGPDVGGPVAPYIQTERRDTYGKYARLLVEKGHAYYCFCEKTESEEDSGEFDRAADPCRDLDGPGNSGFQIPDDRNQRGGKWKHRGQYSQAGHKGSRYGKGNILQRTGELWRFQPQ